MRPEVQMQWDVMLGRKPGDRRPDGSIVEAIEVEAPKARAATRVHAPGYLDGAFIVEMFRNGWQRAEIALTLVPSSTSRIATLYRQVDQVLLDAGLRARDLSSRRSGCGGGTGEAALPVILRPLQ